MLAPGDSLSQWRPLLFAALCAWKWSLAYHTGVSVVAGQAGSGVCVVVVTDLVSRAAVIGCDLRRTG
jgi:hypothetical protein